MKNYGIETTTVLALAKMPPIRLEALILTETLDTLRLACALEELGKVPGNKFLRTLLKFTGEMYDQTVRESAVYGLSFHLNSDIIVIVLRNLCNTENHANFRSVMLEALKDSHIVLDVD